MSEHGQNGSGTPADHASARAGNGGVVPPVERRWTQGQSGNPAGRPPNVGASVEEWMNLLNNELVETLPDGTAVRGLTEEELRAIAKDPRVRPPAKRAAAGRLLAMMEVPDLADFSGLLSGENRLEDLRGMGVNTAVIKKLKQRTRKVPTGDGETEIVIEREIELHDRAGNELDRVCDRTGGKPGNKLHITHDNSLRDPADGSAAAAEIENRLSALFGESTSRGSAG